MDTYECLLRFCDAKMPFAYKGHFRISHNACEFFYPTIS